MTSLPNAICIIEREIERTLADLKHCTERCEIEANHAKWDALEYALGIVKEIDWVKE